jgi:hypothetical protein
MPKHTKGSHGAFDPGTFNPDPYENATDQEGTAVAGEDGPAPDNQQDVGSISDADFDLLPDTTRAEVVLGEKMVEEAAIEQLKIEATDAADAAAAATSKSDSAKAKAEAADAAAVKAEELRQKLQQEADDAAAAAAAG